MNRLLLNTGFLLLAAAPSAAQDAVCAQVKIQISQKAVITRTAFEATLSIDNQTMGPLDQVLVEIDVRDANDEPANDLFAIPSPTLTNLSDVDGGGSVAPGTTGVASWLILAEEDAAPGMDPVTYTVGGSVSHLQDGLLVTVPLYPVEIEVYPDPKLFLDYYLQKRVYSDNPFTDDVIEPSEPFSLGLIVRNAGEGLAKNLKITSSQPEIVENEKGLLVSFQIIGAQIGTEAIQPCLTVDFGDIDPHSSKVARWLLSSTLAGEFVDMDVEFEHVNGLGNPSLSLIEATNIHPLVHVVELSGPSVDPGLDDGLPDFLVDEDGVNDPPGLEGYEDLPTVIHSSEGQKLAIAPVVNANVGAPPTSMNLCVPVSVDLAGPGWSYIRFDDPGGGQYDLGQVVRTGGGGPRHSLTVGSAGDIANAWTTSRLVPVDGPPTSHERLVHIVDHVPAPGTYQYMLTYQPVPELPLTTSLDVISLTAGGQQELFLNAGPGNAGRAYIVLGSMSGTTPGLTFAGLPIPLNYDSYFEILLINPGVQQLFQTVGILDQFGKNAGKVEVIVPPGATVMIPPGGLTLYHAYVLFTPALDFASNVKELVLQP